MHHRNFSVSDRLDLEEFQDRTRESIYCFSVPVESDGLVDLSVGDLCKAHGCLQVTKKGTLERQQDSSLFILNPTL